MREAVVILRPGSIPDPRVFSGKGFVADARAVVGLTESEVQALTEDLASTHGFLRMTDLRDLMERHIESETAERVTRFVSNLDRMARSGRIARDEIAKQLGKALRAGDTGLSSEEIDLLLARTPRLVADAPGLEAQWKAESLTSATGQPLEELEIITDLRPVFDRDRKAVLGMLHVMTLRLTVTSPGGLPESLEITLDEEALERLCEISSRAKEKLAALKILLAEKGIAVPATTDRSTANV